MWRFNGIKRVRMTLTVCNMGGRHCTLVDFSNSIRSKCSVLRSFFAMFVKCDSKPCDSTAVYQMHLDANRKLIISYHCDVDALLWTCFFFCWQLPARFFFSCTVVLHACRFNFLATCLLSLCSNPEKLSDIVCRSCKHLSALIKWLWIMQTHTSRVRKYAYWKRI